MKLLKMSVTKLVLLIIVISLVVIELYKTFKGLELDQVFIDITLMVIAFYYWQKGMKYESVDSVITEETLSDNNKL